MAGRRKVAKVTKLSDHKKKIDDGVDKILDQLQDDLNKKFGDNSVMRLGSQSTLNRLDEWVSSRSMVVDAVLRGGRPLGSSLIPFGRMMEISGLEDSGKSTLCAHIAAEVQSKGGIVLITDTEEKIASDYWSKLGVDLNRVVKIYADNVKEVFDKQFHMLQLAREKAPGRLVLSIWDSLGGTSIHNIVDANSSESPMEQAEKFSMRRAKQVGEGVELLHGIVAKTRTCYLWTNHEYTKMNVKFGSPREVRGGKKPKYYATVRLQLTPVGALTETDAVTGRTKEYGQQVLVKALKNHMSGIKLQRPAYILSGVGFSDEMTVFETARKMKAITGKNWYEWVTPKGEVVGKFQGYKGFLEQVVPHPEYKDLYDAVLQTM